MMGKVREILGRLEKSAQNDDTTYIVEDAEADLKALLWRRCDAR